MRPKRDGYFLPPAALATRFRTRLNEALRRDQPKRYWQIPRIVWRLDWVADAQPVGRGEPALKYLSAYVYRTALSAERIVADDRGRIAFSWRDNQGRNRVTRLTADQFLHRFLQHVLPRNFARMRYFGWLSAAARAKFERIAALLDWQSPPLILAASLPPPECPVCHKPMTLIGRLPRAPPDKAA